MLAYLTFHGCKQQAGKNNNCKQVTETPNGPREGDKRGLMSRLGQYDEEDYHLKGQTTGFPVECDGDEMEENRRAEREEDVVVIS